MGIRVEVVPFLLAALIVGAVLWFTTVPVAGALVGVVIAAYMLYFFRDPERAPIDDPNAIVAAANGVVAVISSMKPFILQGDPQLGKDLIRISIFLSLFDVHVNRAPITGTASFLGYFPGKRLFTFDEKASEYNQHNAILIEGTRTRCLVKQIVGPVCRRVVYWPDHDRPVPLRVGERFGMMKFGSRLDMTFPRSDIEVTVKVGTRVVAGTTVIARLKDKS